jgi:DNA topoisomerase VI subunit B
LQQPRGGLPVGPLVIMIHMASVWVPFTSESKEAIADYDEIRKEMKLALMECGRKLGTYLRKRQAMKRQAERRDVFERYIGEIAKSINAITGEDAKKLYEHLLKEAKKRTAIADAKLDEEGRMTKKDEADELRDDEGVVMVEGRAAHLKDDETAESNDEAPSLSSNGDVVKLSSSRKKKTRKRTAGDDEGLF